MCCNPLRIRNNRLNPDPKFDPDYYTVPCGKCYQCLQAKQFDFETRLVSEYDNCIKRGGFVYNYTLTYNPEHVPNYLGLNVLCRRDMQLFKKRLKSKLGLQSDTIRIFYSGEYGDLHGRPHFHILIFYYPHYKSSVINHQLMFWLVESAWQQGFVGLPNKREFSGWDTIKSIVDGVSAIRYCAKYCIKHSDFYDYIYNYFHDYLDTHNLSLAYEFPKDKRFGFSKTRPITLEYLTEFFGKCFRFPNFCGLSQWFNLDDNYQSTCELFNDGSSCLKYPLSKYCKKKMFYNIKNDNGHLISEKNYNWLLYYSKMFDIFAQSFENRIISNSDLPILYNPTLKSEGYAYIKDVINYLTSHVRCCLGDYVRLQFYFPTSFLATLSYKDALAYSVSRPTFLSDSCNSYYDALVPELVRFNTLLSNINAEISYHSYLKSVDNWNSVQTNYAYLRHTKPKYKKYISFTKFLNFYAQT